MAPPYWRGLLLLLYVPCNLYPLHFFCVQKANTKGKTVVIFFPELAINKGSAIAEFTVVGLTGAGP